MTVLTERGEERKGVIAGEDGWEGEGFNKNLKKDRVRRKVR